MKSKTVEMSDYPEIRDEVRSLIRFEAELRGEGITFNMPHTHRFWEYGSALKAMREAGLMEQRPRVLDVGCGHGPFGPWLASLEVGVDEIDPSPSVESRAELRARLTHQDCLFESKALLSLPDAPLYDAVFAISVMEHVPADQQAASWQKLTSLIRPGGLLFCTMDYGEADSANRDARELIFNEVAVREVVEELAGTFEFDEIDYAVHGNEVFDYTFFRLIGRKK